MKTDNKMKNLIKGFFPILSAISIFVALSTFVFAQASGPLGPDSITIAGSGRHLNDSGPTVIQAQAGNVTALVVAQTRSTQAWQGYYGNITGTITLDDAFNSTLYDWSLPNPTGQIYASNGTGVAWLQIFCVNVSFIRNSTGNSAPYPSGGAGVYSFNGSQIERLFGINASDRDGLNETFNDTYTNDTGFRVGGVTIDNTDGCSLAHPYQNEVYDSMQWQELLLSDNTSIVFTSLIRENANGFQAGTTDTYDFEMLVLENGHAGQELTLTNYYFYVELS